MSLCYIGIQTPIRYTPYITPTRLSMGSRSTAKICGVIAILFYETQVVVINQIH